MLNKSKGEEILKSKIKGEGRVAPGKIYVKHFSIYSQYIIININVYINKAVSSSLSHELIIFLFYIKYIDKLSDNTL